MHQGNAKDSGWGSDEEAAAVPETEAEETASAAAPAPQQTARKQVASAFDLLQGSDDEAETVSPQAASSSDAEANGAFSELDSGADSAEESEGQQVMYLSPLCMHVAVLSACPPRAVLHRSASFPSARSKSVLCNIGS